MYGDGLNVRDWIHAKDHAKALDLLLQKGKAGEVYNIGGNNEKMNKEITTIILNTLNKSESLICPVRDRLGHDRRYALDSSKINSLGWAPVYDFDEAMNYTIKWYQDNSSWWQEIKSGEYKEYYEKMYGRK